MSAREFIYCQLYYNICVNIECKAWNNGRKAKTPFRQHVRSHAYMYASHKWARNVHSFNRLDDLIRLFLLSKSGSASEQGHSLNEADKVFRAKW